MLCVPDNTTNGALEVSDMLTRDGLEFVLKAKAALGCARAEAVLKFLAEL